MRVSRLALGTMLICAFAACGGGGGGDDDGDDSADPPTSYRADFVELRDPHLFALNGALDVTGTVNTELDTGVTEDGDEPPDGYLDLSLVLVFRPVDLAAASTPVDAVLGADCTAPITTTTCATGDADIVESTATNGDSACLTAMAGTLGGYNPAPTEPAGPCFVTDMETVTINAGTVALTLEDARLSADYGATGAPDRLENGLLVGFMTEANADATIIPEDTPIVGGEPLSTLLKDEDNDGGGWWFYINFSGNVVEYTE
jgi:hypothetical protein